MGIAIDPSMLLQPVDANIPTVSPKPNTEVAKGTEGDSPLVAAQSEGSLKRESSVVDLSDKSEGAKRARLIARQERNRQSAQCSREKKKLYVVNLEEQVKQLQHDKIVATARESEAVRQRLELEQKVSELGSKVQSLQNLVHSLLGTRAPCASTSAEPAFSSMASVAPIPTEIAPSAAPVAVPPTALDASGPDTFLHDSTCLPAAEATRRESGVAQQWVLKTRARKASLRSGLVERRIRRPTAAALVHPGVAELLTLLSQARVSADSSTQAVMEHPWMKRETGRPLRFRLAIPRRRTLARPAAT